MCVNQYSYICICLHASTYLYTPASPFCPRNRAIHGDKVIVEILPRNQWTSARNNVLSFHDTSTGKALHSYASFLSFLLIVLFQCSVNCVTSQHRISDWMFCNLCWSHEDAASNSSIVSVMSVMELGSMSQHCFPYVVRAIPAVGCVRVRVVCWVGNGSRDLPKGSSMGATLAFRRTGMCIAPPTWHMRCAAWYYKYRCMLFCNPSSRESGTLVITESFGLRHQEEPCACGEPRVSQDNTYTVLNNLSCFSFALLF